MKKRFFAFDIPEYIEIVRPTIYVNSAFNRKDYLLGVRFQDEIGSLDNSESYPWSESLAMNFRYLSNDLDKSNLVLPNIYVPNMVKKIDFLIRNWGKDEENDLMDIFENLVLISDVSNETVTIFPTVDDYEEI